MAGQSLLRLDREDGTAAPVDGTPAMRDALAAAAAVLVSDYGRGLVAGDELRGWLTDAARQVPVVWDPHPRGGAPVPGVRLATPNLGEAVGFAGTGSSRRAGQRGRAGRPGAGARAGGPAASR